MATEREWARIRAAFNVQERLLVEPPEVAGVRIAVAWRPFEEVSGDFYDFAELEEGSVGVTIGDISGKGYHSALLMVFALAETRAGIRMGCRLPLIMNFLDESLRTFTSESKFAEVLMGIYSVQLKRFVYVQGGGISPVVYRRASERLFVYRSPLYRLPGVPQVGQRLQPYVEETVDLNQGDIMLLFSDGVSEREDGGGQLVRRDGVGALVSPSLFRICKDAANLDAVGVRDRILAFLAQLGSPPKDDETLIVLKVE